MFNAASQGGFQHIVLASSHNTINNTKPIVNISLSQQFPRILPQSPRRLLSSPQFLTFSPTLHCSRFRNCHGCVWLRPLITKSGSKSVVKRTWLNSLEPQHDGRSEQ